jgi:hypothetical protein
MLMPVSNASWRHHNPNNSEPVSDPSGIEPDPWNLAIFEIIPIYVIDDIARYSEGWVNRPQHHECHHPQNRGPGRPVGQKRQPYSAR